MTAAPPHREHDDRPHVVFVLPSLKVGGAEGYLASVLEADPASTNRYRVTVLTFLPERSEGLAARLEAAGASLATVDRTRTSFPAFFAALVRFFRLERPDLVHSLLAGSTGSWGRLAARLAGVPHVMLSDRSLNPSRTPAQRAVDGVVHRLTTRFTPNAQAIADRLARQGVPRERIRVVRNGVDVRRFSPEGATMRARWGVPEDAVVAGFLGMLRPKKRPDLFLDGLLALPASQRPDLAVIGGDGEMAPALRERIEADPWLREHCRLEGLVEDTPTFLRSIDFLVLTSDTEGMPNAILEAMASGRPVVATRVSDVPYLVQDERFVVPPGDAEGLAIALSRMTSLSEEERAAMGRAAASRAREEFSMEAAARRFWSAHEDLLEGDR